MRWRANSLAFQNCLSLLWEFLSIIAHGHICTSDGMKGALRCDICYQRTRRGIKIQYQPALSLPSPWVKNVWAQILTGKDRQKAGVKIRFLLFSEVQSGIWLKAETVKRFAATTVKELKCLDFLPSRASIGSEQMASPFIQCAKKNKVCLNDLATMAFKYNRLWDSQ